MSEPTPIEATLTASEDEKLSEVEGPAERAAEAHRRVDLYDGLRGVAIVLVVLSHGWQLWPVDWIDSHAAVRPLFRNGNAGVSVFLVAAGFLMYRSLTARRPLAAMRADTAFVRRVARVGPSLWLFLLVVVSITALDETTKAWNSDTAASVFHVVTYTWNWYVQGNLVTSRPDFGHLWYLSVDMQAFAIMAAFLYMLRRRHVGLIFALVGFYLLLLWWRFHVAHTENDFQVLVRTTVRMDPFVVGVLTAVVLPDLARLRISARALAWAATGSLLALVPILYWCDRDVYYLRWGGTVLEWDLALFMAAVALGGGSALTSGLIGNRVATWLGRNSLLIYIWHYPVFAFVARHTTGPGWSWEGRTVVAMSAVAAIVVAADRLLERRVVRWLRQPGWRDLDDGIPHYVATHGRPVTAQLFAHVGSDQADHRDHPDHPDHPDRPERVD
jgi:peptidoglycan/LPS O-acetylase OafA/YrhL